jgi:hypothetical protein
VRVQLNGKNYLSLAEVRVLDAKGTNLAQGRPALQSSSIGAASGQPGKAVDGITDGDFAKGSVTHTGADDGAWWEVDLGESREIGSVQVFNRTDGAGERLSDFWLFVSDSPFTPADTPATLSARAGTAKVRVTGRPSPSVAVAASAPVPGPADTVLFDNGYFRLLGEAGGATAAKFWTNRASEFQLEVNAAKPARLQYLFWPNERLTYFLNGRSIRTTIEDGLVTVPVPAGRHRFEMQYTYWPLKIFLFFYALYALGLGALLIYPAVPPPWRARIASLWTRNRRPIGQKAAAA